MEWTMSHDSCSCNNWTLVYFVLHHSPVFIFFPRAQTALRILLSQRCPLDPCAFSFMSPRTTQIWNSTVLNSRTPKPSWILFPAGDGEQEEVFCLPPVGYRSSDCPWPLFSALGWISSDCPGTLSISKFLSYSEVAMCLVLSILASPHPGLFMSLFQVRKEIYLQPFCCPFPQRGRGKLIMEMYPRYFKVSPWGIFFFSFFVDSEPNPCHFRIERSDGKVGRGWFGEDKPHW